MNELSLVEAIRERNNDDEARLIYADWLDERGDARVDYLRLHVEIGNRIIDKQDWSELRPRLRELSENAPLEWREQVGRRYDVVLAAPPESGRFIDTIGALRAFAEIDLRQAKELVHSTPALVRASELLEDALKLKLKLEEGSWNRSLPMNAARRCLIEIVASQ